MQSRDHRYPDFSDGSLSVADHDNEVLAEVDFKAEDSHHSSGSENEMSSLSTPPASDGGRSMSPANSESSDDDDFDMTFLTEKRNILQRYCEALHATESYHASIAKNPIPETSNSIWDEARELMDEMFDTNECKQKRSLPNTDIESRPLASKRPRIDISNVTRIDASACNNGAGDIHGSLISTNGQLSTFPNFYDSKCMVNAFRRLSSFGCPSRSAAEAEAAGSVEVRESCDMDFHPALEIPCLVPRKYNEVGKGTTMDEALGISDIAQ